MAKAKPINAATVAVGQRLRFAPAAALTANGYIVKPDNTFPFTLAVNGAPVTVDLPLDAVFEVKTVSQNNVAVPKLDAFGVEVGWRDKQGAPQRGFATLYANVFGWPIGRPLFPGEAPPKQGDTFGVTGRNNDYAKQRKQGKRAALPAGSTPTAAPTSTPEATMATTQDGLSAFEKAAIDQLCPVCNTGALALKTGVGSKGPYAFVSCDAFPKCRTTIKPNGDVVTAKKGGTAQTLGSIDSNGNFVPAPVAAPTAPTPTESAPAGTPAPAAKAAPAPSAKPMKLGMSGFVAVKDGVRKMFAAGEVSMPFSFRSWEHWINLSAAFQSEGASEQDATDRSFVMAYLDKLGEEERKAVRTLYQSVMARYPDRTLNSPLFGLIPTIAMCWKHRIPLWVYGPAGCGKSYGVMETFRNAGVTFLRHQGSRYAQLDELAGSKGLNNGSTVDEPGLIEMALTGQMPLMLDEIDQNPGAVLDELRAILEDLDKGGKYMNRRTGKWITSPAGDTSWIVATGNSNGNGEGAASYVGINVVNAALRDRFAMLRTDYPDAVTESSMIRSYAAARGVTLY